jgi:hypothetical protein
MQPVLLWKSSNYCISWVCVCILSYPACNVHAPYCHLWSVRIYSIVQHYLKKAWFSKKLLNIKCGFWFSLWFWSETCHYRKEWVRYHQKCILVFIYSTCFTCQILMKLWFSRQIFEKYSNIRFHENPSSGSRVPCGRTDGQTHMIKLIVAFRNLANAPKTAYHKDPHRNSIKGCRT